MFRKFLSLTLVSLFFHLTVSAQVSPPAPIDTAKDGDVIFDRIEIEASYPGGLQAWRKFLEKNLNASVPVNNGAPAGYFTVIVRFIVSKDGSVSEVKALSNLGYGMEQEVIRIIKKSGKWNTGYQNNKPVNSYHTQPVTFVVINDGLNISTSVPNKLFVGVNNLISISVTRIKPEDLSATITNGRITPLKDGNYKVTVNDTTRRAVITVYNAKKGNKEIGSESFEVRPQREAPDADKPKQ